VQGPGGDTGPHDVPRPPWGRVGAGVGTLILALIATVVLVVIARISSDVPDSPSSTLPTPISDPVRGSSNSTNNGVIGEPSSPAVPVSSLLEQDCEERTTTIVVGRCRQ
jgi:hypothetical protein